MWLPIQSQSEDIFSKAYNALHRMPDKDSFFFLLFILLLLFISPYYYTLRNIIFSSTFITKKPVSFLVIICIVALFICIPSNFPWSISLPSKNKMFSLVLLDSIMDINTMINSCHQLHYIWQSESNIHILWKWYSQEVVSSTPAPDHLSRKCCLCNYNAVAESLPGNWRS